MLKISLKMNNSEISIYNDFVGRDLSSFPPVFWYIINRRKTYYKIYHEEGSVKMVKEVPKEEYDKTKIPISC